MSDLDDDAIDIEQTHIERAPRQRRPRSRATLDVCVGETVDRIDPDYSPYLASSPPPRPSARRATH